ncbi:MAG TPA: hypothetical protein VD886_12440 [Herpetosiphonaceae bacterium]|nr:hypothetical protein [Herpetosiphonaceae bacterium]
MRCLIRTLLALASFILLWTPAAACSPARFEVSVACPGEQPVTAFSDEDVLPLLGPDCAAALGPEVRQLIADRQRRDKEYFIETRFSVEPWTAAGEDQLRDQERNPLQCRYQRWQHSGDWLVSEDAGRSYCGPALGVCSSSRLSWVRFLGFALVNPAARIWPYTLAAWLIVLGAGFWLARLTRRRQLAVFLRPGLWLGLGFAVALIAVLIKFATSWLDIAAWAVILYLLACAARWGVAPAPKDQ